MPGTLTIDHPAAGSLGDIDTEDQASTVNHFVRNADITRSLVEGIAVRAVCGQRFVVGAQGGGRMDAADAIVCAACQSRYERMRP